jgi:hypothetical protein
VWQQIARLRQRDPHLLAPAIMSAWDRGRMACNGLFVNVSEPDAPEDLVDLASVTLIETLRVQALQDIYFAQGATRAKSVLKSWHAYGMAFDVVHRTYGWFTNAAAIKRWPNKKRRDVVAIRWYRAVSGVLTRGGALAWGGLWKQFPDSPHFQSAVTPITPPDSTVALYQQAGEGEAGRRAVWAHYRLT